MLVTYTPEDGEPQSWEFSPGRVRQSEAEAIEKKAGCRWDEWVVLAKAEQAHALRVLLWHLMRRTHERFRYEDVPDFLMDEVSVELDLGELLETRAEVEKRSNLFTEDQLRGVLSELDTEIADRRDRGQVEPGKANSKKNGKPTVSQSPPA